MTALLAITSALAIGALHAIRGGGAQWLRFVIAGLAGLAGFAAGLAPLLAAAQSGGVLLYLVQPWGRWYMLGAGDRGWSGPPGRYEAALERLADRLYPPRAPQLTHSARADALAWLISASLFALPLAALVSPWWIIIAPATVGLYGLALMLAGLGPHVRLAEAAKGAIIGLLAVLLAGCAQPAGRGSILHDPYTRTLR
ncbi:hypothetical protein [Microcystis phage vB_MweS-yong2]|nr:hypothetical protein [Microcystis phage vB_MweS-yong2]